LLLTRKIPFLRLLSRHPPDRNARSSADGCRDVEHEVVSGHHSADCLEVEEIVFDRGTALSLESGSFFRRAP
jgi:hypothetical protein